MRRAHQIADIERLADALNADAEISTHDIRHSRKLAARATARQVVLVSELQIVQRCMDQNA
jgi:hypothetical protein